MDVFEAKVVLSVMNTLNIFLTGILIISYFTSRQLQGHPGGIIVSLAFCELATSYHSTIFSWGSGTVVHLLTIDGMRVWGYANLQDYVFNVTCGVNITMITFGVISGLLYNLILCIDLILSIRNPFAVATKRMPWYHLIVGVASLALAGYISLNSILESCENVACNRNFFKNDQDFHKCLEKYDICHENDEDFSSCVKNYEHEIEYFENQDKFEFIEDYKNIFLPLFGIYALVGLMSAIYGIFELKKDSKLSNVALKRSLTRHILYLGISTLMFGYMAFSLYIAENDEDGRYKTLINQIAGYVFSLGGVLLAIVRFMNEDFRIKILKGKLFVGEFDENDQGDNEWNRSSFDALTELKADLASKIFYGLHTVYSKSFVKTDQNHHGIEGLKEVANDAPNRMLVDFAGKNSSLSQTLLKIETGIVITQYCPASFHKIIRKSAMDYNIFKQSLDPTENQKSIINATESKGKSGSFFLATEDHKFLIKTVKASEIEVLKKMAKSYSKHMEGNTSLLCKIFGVFLLNIPGITPINLIIMENINSEMSIEKIYDLKGSTLGRETKYLENIPNNVVPFKDIDFIRKKEKIIIEGDDINEIIMKDTDFLKNNNLLDYSLLVCIGKKKGETEAVQVYKIIDYLIEYQFLKKVERAFVTLLNPRTKDRASVMSPENYANRFRFFMKMKVFEIKASS